MNITTFAKRLCLLVPLLLSPAAFAVEMMPSPPQLAAKAYVLMDASSGNVLVENNGDQRLPPASLTKLMTAYIATLEIRRGQIGENDPVTVTCEPTLMNIREPPVRQAFSLTVTGSFSPIWPRRISRVAMYAVISLVRLAGGRRWSPLFSTSTLPLLASMST